MLNCKCDYVVTFWCALRSNKQGESYSKSDPLYKPTHQEHFSPVVLQMREAGKGDAWQFPHPQQIPGSASALGSCSQDPVTGQSYVCTLPGEKKTAVFRRCLAIGLLKESKPIR